MRVTSCVDSRGERRIERRFADSETRSDPFTETEELFVELLAERIGSTLEQQTYETELVQRSDRLY